MKVIDCTHSESNSAQSESESFLLNKKKKTYFLFAAQSSEIRRRLSSELAVLAAGVQALTSGSATPCSADTGYSDQRLDTPPSASSQGGGGGTPYSSRSGTPFSQDSGYSGARSVHCCLAYREFHIKVLPLPCYCHYHEANSDPSVKVRKQHGKLAVVAQIVGRRAGIKF